MSNRIVIVEDDPAILRGLAEQLRMESYDVFTATHGEDGYRLVRDKEPDLVILDLMLPGMSGYEICQQLRKHGMATPVLMLTAQDQEANRVKGFEAGADDYVTKPFSIRELMGRVRAILRRSEGRQDLANQRELDEARHIQERLMPSVIPQFPGLNIAATCRPARIAGGDYFDILNLGDGAAAICIADVCGKGMPAAMVTASLQASVKAFASTSMRPREVCARVNRIMYSSLAGQGFITFFYALINPREKRLTYCNAGHNAPILVSGSSVRYLQCGGGILGVVEDWDYKEERIQLRSGDRLLLYTDGITESCNASGEEFGEERLTNLATHFRNNDAAALLEKTIDAVRRFSNTDFEDDVTVMAVSID